MFKQSLLKKLLLFLTKFINKVCEYIYITNCYKWCEWFKQEEMKIFLDLYI